MSPRRFEGVLREPSYGPDHAVRRVRHIGEIRWRGNRIYISEALIGEPVGLVEDEEGGWSAFYGPIALGVIAHGGDRLRKPKHQAHRPNNNSRPERNGKCVTHVPGQNCHPCSRLLSEGVG